MGAGDDLKDDFKSIGKHFKKLVKNVFRGIKNGINKKIGVGEKRENQGRWSYKYPPRQSRPNRFFPFFLPRSPLMLLCYPKIVIGMLILVALLFCGVGLYGLIVIILLLIIFILI